MIDVTDSNTIYYYHFDGLGSVAALSNVNGDIVERYSYDIFGEPNRTSDVNNPYMFTGRRYDTEVSFYYYRARFYKPDIGRFLQTDPLGYVNGMNLYTYVGNNPLNWIDPWGLLGFGIGISGSGGTGVGGTVGAQFVFDLDGNSGVFVHAGGGAFVGSSGGGTLDVSAFTGSATDLSGFFSSTGGSGGEVLIGGGEFHWGAWNGEVGVTGSIGLGGGPVPGEGHHFVEMGQFIEASEFISPKIIADFWTGVSTDAWDWLKDQFQDNDKFQDDDQFQDKKSS